MDDEGILHITERRMLAMEERVRGAKILLIGLGISLSLLILTKICYY